jgi:hypothetical protein
MSIWNQTKDDIVVQIENLHRRISNQNVITSLERDIILKSINTAFVQICTDFGVERWDWLEKPATATLETQSETLSTYTGLGSAEIFDYVEGTMSVTDEHGEKHMISIVDVAQITELRAAIKDESSTRSFPVAAAPIWTAGPSLLEFEVFPKADQDYQVTVWCKTLIDSEDISKFPANLRPALVTKCKSNALCDLGHLQESTKFERMYDKSLLRFNQSISNHVPRHVSRRYGVASSSRGIQSRAGGV